MLHAEFETPDRAVTSAAAIRPGRTGASSGTGQNRPRRARPRRQRRLPQLLRARRRTRPPIALLTGRNGRRAAVAKTDWAPSPRRHRA